jgi:hypothetical protein
MRRTNTCKLHCHLLDELEDSRHMAPLSLDVGLDFPYSNYVGIKYRLYCIAETKCRLMVMKKMYLTK